LGKFKKKVFKEISFIQIISNKSKLRKIFLLPTIIAVDLVFADEYTNIHGITLAFCISVSFDKLYFLK